MIAFSHETSHNLHLQPIETESAQPIVLSVEQVSKKFCRSLKRSLLYGVQDIAAEIVGLRQSQDTLREQEFWAVKDVSFHLRRGEALGLIGKNGSGKSTLLRIIAGLIKPDAGTVTVHGRVAPLIALGAGFSPVLTGRENIYANMSILGLSTHEIDECFEQVVDFAEIGDAIDSPVQNYSSGMAARLGFATAIHTEPDILLVDEVLAVGDIKFREKCHRKLCEIRKKGTSLILVSHSNHEVSNVCELAMYLAQGKLIDTGSVFSVLDRYIKDLAKSEQSVSLESSSQLEISQPNSSNSKLCIIDLYFKDHTEAKIISPFTGAIVSFCIKCNVQATINNVNLYVIIKSEDLGTFRLNISSFHDQVALPSIEPGDHELRLEIPCLVLNPGYYSMDIYVKEDSLYTHAVIEAFRFQVKGKADINQNLFYQPRNWRVLKNIPK